MSENQKRSHRLGLHENQNSRHKFGLYENQKIDSGFVRIRKVHIGLIFTRIKILTSLSFARESKLLITVWSKMLTEI